MLLGQPFISWRATARRGPSRRDLVPTERCEARLHQARPSPTRCVTFPPRPGSRSNQGRGGLTASTTWQGLGNAPETPMVGRRTIPNATRASRPARNDDCAIIKSQGMGPSDIGRTTGVAGRSDSVRNSTRTATRTLRHPTKIIRRRSRSRPTRVHTLGPRRAR